MKNPHAEAGQFQRRAAIGFIGIAVALSGLCFGYFRLQVWQHEEYRTRSEANRIKPRPVVPARGLIYDRNGRLLSDNVPAYRLEVVPDQTGDLADTLERLNALIGLSKEELQQFQATRKAIRSFRPVVLKLRLSEDQRALADRVAAHAVREVDDLRLRVDRPDDAVADAHEVVVASVVGEQRDDHVASSTSAVTSP